MNSNRSHCDGQRSCKVSLIFCLVWLAIPEHLSNQISVPLQNKSLLRKIKKHLSQRCPALQNVTQVIQDFIIDIRTSLHRKLKTSFNTIPYEEKRTPSPCKNLRFFKLWLRPLKAKFVTLVHLTIHPKHLQSHSLPA